MNQLGGIESKFGLTSLPPLTEAADRLRNLLDHLYQKTDRQVVVLVDEYDKPVLDVLEDDEKARANRDCLREIGLAKIAEVEITERKVPDFEEWIKNAYHELPDGYNGEVINLTEDMPPQLESLSTNPFQHCFTPRDTIRPTYVSTARWCTPLLAG